MCATVYSVHCLQVEIDEYQDYQKAQGALRESHKCLTKAKTKNPAALEAKIKFLNQRLQLVKKFADARKSVKKIQSSHQTLGPVQFYTTAMYIVQ